MDSTSDRSNSITTNTGDRLVRFETAEDFRSRPLYREQVDPASHPKLLRPVGPYGFPRERFVTCGLKGCHRPHGIGLVVLLEGNVETNVGHCCGAKRYGLQWQEMERFADRVVKRQALEEKMAQLVRERDARLARCEDLLQSVVRLEDAVANVLDVLQSDRQLKRAFDECVRGGGELVYFRELSDDERALFPGQRTAPVRAGKLDGVDAAAVHGLSSDLRFKVIFPLKEFVPETGKMTEKRVDALLATLAGMDDVVSRSERFIEQARRFVSPENWNLMQTFCVQASLGVNWKTHNRVRKLAGLGPRGY
jgi:hypothetical protein